MNAYLSLEIPSKTVLRQSAWVQVLPLHKLCNLWLRFLTCQLTGPTSRGDERTLGDSLKYVISTGPRLWNMPKKRQHVQPRYCGCQCLGGSEAELPCLS